MSIEIEFGIASSVWRSGYRLDNRRDVVLFPVGTRDVSFS
jgi:hypothetical protein